VLTPKAVFYLCFCVHACIYKNMTYSLDVHKAWYMVTLFPQMPISLPGSLSPSPFLPFYGFFLPIALSWRSHTLSWVVAQAALADRTAVFSLNTNTGSSCSRCGFPCSVCGIVVFVCCAVIDLWSLTPVLIARRSSSLNLILQMVFLEKK